MKHINQPTSATGCGIAAFAMVAGFESYASAESWMMTKGVVKPNGFVTIPQMRMAIETIMKCQTSVVFSLSRSTDPALCFVDYTMGNSKYRHWVFKYKGQYYDPAPGCRTPKRFLRRRVKRVVNVHC